MTEPLTAEEIEAVRPDVERGDLDPDDARRLLATLDAAREGLDLTDIPAADMTDEQYEAWRKAGYPARGPIMHAAREGLDVERLARALAVVSPLTPPDNFTRYSEAAATAIYRDTAERIAARYAALATPEEGT